MKSGSMSSYRAAGALGPQEPDEEPRMTELEEAIALAHRILDRPNADPDSDEAMLARHFLRGLDDLKEAVRDLNLAPNPDHEELAKKFRLSQSHEVEGTPESLALCAKMLDTYAPDLYPANEKGQVSFARAMMESAADEIRKFLAYTEQLRANADPPVYRLQFPDGTVPGSAREAAEGWKRWADRFLQILTAHRRFHNKVGCPGRPECYVCAEEEWHEEYKDHP